MMHSHPLGNFTSQPGGGRSGSSRYRELHALCEDFEGLGDDTDRYDLLLLVKRTGKAGGFTPKMIQLLDYYMAFTRDQDWEEGARPIVYQSLAKTSLDLGVSERQIQRLEQALFEAGAITWNDSGNHRRYGQRCPETGRIEHAFGIDLSPLALLKSELQARLEDKLERDRRWLDLKRHISGLRARIRSGIGELADREEGPGVLQWQAEYERIALPIRTYMGMDALEGLLSEHQNLYEGVLGAIGGDHSGKEGRSMSKKRSPRDDKDVVHYKSTNHESKESGRHEVSCFQESVAGPPEPENARTREEGPSNEQEENIVLSTGLQHVTLKQALNASSERFREHIPMEPRPMNWHDLVEAAYRLRPVLHISQQSWGEACLVLGRNGAAVCLLLTDRAMFREKDPVLKPAAYFASLIRRAGKKELNLQRSIFGILKREEGAQ